MFSDSNDWNCQNIQLGKCERIRVEMTACLSQWKLLKYSNENLTLKEASDLDKFIFMWKSKNFEQVRCNDLLGYEIFQNLQLIFPEKK